MDIKQYQQYVSKGMSENYTPELALLGLAGEVGEVCDVAKKDSIYPGKYTPQQLYDKLIDELGDVAWQLFAAACTLGVPMTQILEKNVAKLNERHGGAVIDITGGKR